ncbi:hypothetical protein TSUD_04860 [Trifolium subterraneum]|uniref:Uncharacterized protein n=1 Tax=Trifolium subterraneum TaxID=3900 RepID=A0A2Z6N4S3_TRISU|nr:hypothetical protein TSUD_04860 [Trifolium subterraneum]
MKSLDFDNNLEVGKNVKAQPVLERGAVSGSGSNAGSPAVSPPPSSPVESPCAVSSQTDGARVQLEIHQKISSEFIDRKREELNKVRQDVQETEALASSSSNQLFSRSSTPYGGKMFTSYVLWY